MERKQHNASHECKGCGCDAFGNVIDGGVSVLGLAYSYDALSRPVTRNGDTFAYNNRSEVVSSRGGAENAEAYAYDEIGNLLCASFNLTTNVYAANNLNQYTAIQENSAASRTLARPSGSPTANLPFEAKLLRRISSPRETDPTYDAGRHLSVVPS